MHQTLIAPSDLRAHLDGDCVIVDCRFSLQDTERGRRAYEEAHIPGAVYAHLDDDLSAEVIPGRTGRHPLPTPEAFAATLSGWGVGDGIQVVAYDDAGGAIAARLWWMLRWLGHDAVAVLDGAWQRWTREGHPVRGGHEAPTPRPFTPRPNDALRAERDEVDALRTDASCRLLDARAPERYSGAHEPIDPVAGHIPGAHSAPFAGNLSEDGTFLSPDDLRARYAALLDGAPPERTVVYCGSGVTAAHDLLALAHAGLSGARLYPGSWSEWITALPDA